MKNWHLITLIGLTASFTGCATTENETYQSRDRFGNYQTTKTIKQDTNRQSDERFSKKEQRINWDNW